MLKLKKILYEGGKLFAPHSERVTTDEMNKIVDELRLSLSDLFRKFQTTRSLESKVDHGDVDILVMPKADWKTGIKNILGDDIKDEVKNGGVHSYLIYFPSIDKQVHVDFIVAGDENKFKSMAQYYIFNDFSGVIGIFAQHLNFSYGSEGFLKRYKDKRNQWHKLFITNDLMQGLKILGYENPEAKIDQLETLDDIAEFMLESTMLDYTYFEQKNMNTTQRKDVKGRDNIKHILDKVRASYQKASIFDEDHFLKKLYPNYYEDLMKKIDKIEKETYIQSKYNGKWLIDNFGLKPGPIIGDILRQLTKKFGDDIDNANEEEVKKFVETLV